MKGLSMKEFEEITKFVQTYHPFGWVDKEDRLTKNDKPFKMSIKYIESLYDSRDQTIWRVEFVGYGAFSTSHYNGLNLPPKGFTYHSLRDWVLAFLKGETDATNLTLQIKCANGTSGE